MGQILGFPRRMEVLEVDNGGPRSASEHQQYLIVSFLVHGIHCCLAFPQLVHCIFLKMMIILQYIKMLTLKLIYTNSLLLSQ